MSVKIGASIKNTIIPIKIEDWVTLCEALRVTLDCDIKDIIRKIKIHEDNMREMAREMHELKNK